MLVSFVFISVESILSPFIFSFLAGRNPPCILSYSLHCVRWIFESASAVSVKNRISNRNRRKGHDREKHKSENELTISPSELCWRESERERVEMVRQDFRGSENDKEGVRRA